MNSRFELSPQRRELLAALLRAEGIDRGPATTIPRRPDPAAPVPLTFAQRRFWFLERFAAHDAAYVISTALRIRGPFSAERFAEACQLVVGRHEALRTVFLEVDAEPQQLVKDELPADVRIQDVAPATGAALRAAVEEREAELLAEPFDLAHGPLVRVRVLRFAADDTVVLLAVHHIVSDRWSMTVLLRELTDAYRARLAGTPFPSPPLTVHYADVAAWQHDVGVESRWADDLAYWTERLAGAPPELALPTDAPRPREKSYRGASVPVALPRTLVEGVRTLAREAGVTPFAVITAVYALLLSRLSGQRDLVLGTPVANRPLVEMEPLVGLFVNTVALRVDLSGAPSVRELVTRTGALCVAAFDHQAIPFERLVEELRPERSPASTPIFAVLISYQTVPATAGSDGPVRLEPLGLPAAKAEFDLMLDLFEDGDRISGRLEYSLDLFEAATAERLAALFVGLLRQALAGPDRRVEDVAMVDPRTEDESVLAGPVPDRPGGIGEWFDTNATATPDAVVVCHGESRVSYRELAERVDVATRRLRSAGVEPATQVVVDDPDPVERVVRSLAAVRLGAVPTVAAPGAVPPGVTLNELGRQVLAATRLLGPGARLLDAGPPEPWATLAPVVSGGTLVLADATDPAALIETARTERVTVLRAAPARLALLVEEPGVRRCRTLRHVLCDGEPPPRRLAERVRARTRADFSEIYGPIRGHGSGDGVVSPACGAVLRVTDEAGQPLPPGVHGRVEGTGDRGRITADGRLEIRERARAVTLVRGFRVATDEVESTLLAHPRLRAAVVVGRGDHLVAYVVPDDDAPAAASIADELRALARERLPEYAVPRTWVALPELPLTRDGLLDRGALPELAPSTGSRGSATLTGAERSVAAIWSDLLGVTDVGPDDDFFALGGHSLLAVRLEARVREEHGVRLTLRDVFDSPTVSGLAARIVAGAGAGAGAADAGDPEISPVDRRAAQPLSFAQEQLVRHHPRGPRDPVHNVVTALRLRGQLDVSALRRALDELTMRHEPLRSRVRSGPDGPDGPDGPVQLVAAEGGWPLSEVDARGGSAPARQQAVETVLEAQRRAPFDPATEPMVRGALLRTADDEWVLVLAIHHLVTDNWSYAVLVRDLRALYSAALAGHDAELPPLAVQFADLVAWQRTQLAEGAFDRHLAYWRSQLAAPLPALRLSAATPAVAPLEGHTHGFVVAPGTTAALRALAREEGATPFMTLLSAFAVQLLIAGGGDDLPIVFPEAGRVRPEATELVGYLVHTLLVRADLTGDPTVRTVLARVRDRTLDAYAHRAVPVWAPGVLPAAGPDPTRTLFNLLNAEIPALDLPGVSISPVRAHNDYVFSEVVDNLEPAEADLALMMREVDGGLRGTWLFDPAVHDPRAVAVVVDQWPRLLALIGDDPDVRLSRLRGRLARVSA